MGYNTNWRSFVSEAQICGYQGCRHLVKATGACGDRLCPRNAELGRASATPPRVPHGGQRAGIGAPFEVDDLLGAPSGSLPGWPAPRREERIWTPDLTSYPRPPKNQRQPYPYEVSFPSEIASAPILLPGQVATDVDEAARALTHLNASAEARHYELVASPLLRTEAVSSSRIEGLRASHRAIAEAREVPGLARRAAVEIANNVRAMEVAVELAREGPLDVAMIRRIHQILAEGTALQDVAGELRTTQNWIGPSDHGPFEATYVPPPAQDVERLLSDLSAFARRQDVPAIAQAGIVHAQFEGIHPFADGNGRVGRVLIHVVLRNRGVAPTVVPPVSVVLAADRSAYDRGLAAYQQEGDVGSWLTLFARTTTVAAERAEELGADIAELVDDWEARLGRPRAGTSDRLLLPLLIERPMVSAATAAEALDLTETATRRTLGRLELAGVIRQVTVGRRNRVWAAEEVFDLLDRFEHTIATAGDGLQVSPTRHLRTDTPGAHA